MATEKKILEDILRELEKLNANVDLYIRDQMDIG